MNTTKLNPKVENYREIKGEWGTKQGVNYGLFFIESPCVKNQKLQVICAPMDSEWQHVSVSLPNRCPNWVEMSFIKDLFWSDEETVMQFHPKKSEYINNHPYCLHLWRKRGENFKLPPSILIDIKI